MDTNNDHRHSNSEDLEEEEGDDVVEVANNSNHSMHSVYDDDQSNNFVLLSSSMSNTLPWSVRISNLFFRMISAFLRLIFSVVYSRPGKRRMPPIKDPILLESATSLARKIRRREVWGRGVSL